MSLEEADREILRALLGEITTTGAFPVASWSSKPKCTLSYDRIRALEKRGLVANRQAETII